MATKADSSIRPFNIGHSPKQARHSPPVPYSHEEENYREEASTMVTSGNYDNRKEDIECERIMPISTTKLSAEWRIEKRQFLKLNFKKIWQAKRMAAGKLTLLLVVRLVPDLIVKNEKRSTHLLVCVKILKNKFPEYKYEVNAAATLCDGNEILSETRMERLGFEDHKDSIDFMLGMAPQEVIEKVNSSELKLSVAIQVHETMRKEVSCHDKDEFVMVDLLQ